MSVSLKKIRCRDKAGSFVSIQNRVIADDPKCVCRSQLKNVRLFVRELVFGPSERGLKQPFVSYSGEPAKRSQQLFMEREHELLLQPNWLLHLASSRRVNAV